VKSKNELPPLTSSKDFALSKPMEVPNPPFNFRTTVCYYWIYYTLNIY
jgi:hypothetical protein